MGDFNRRLLVHTVAVKIRQLSVAYSNKIFRRTRVLPGISRESMTDPRRDGETLFPVRLGRGGISANSFPGCDADASPSLVRVIIRLHVGIVGRMRICYAQVGLE